MCLLGEGILPPALEGNMKIPYFSHDQNARNDPKITKIRAKYGIEGYGCYFVMLEMMSAERDRRLDYSDDFFDAIAYDLRLGFDLKSFIDDCIKVGLFSSDGTVFWSESFDRRCKEASDKAAARSSAASKAAAARWKKALDMRTQCDCNAFAMQTHEEPDPFSMNGSDPEWMRVALCYEQNIGLIPNGVAFQQLYSFFSDMGADVVCEAIKTTNKLQPDNPYRFLVSVLNRWVEKGIKTIEQAKAAVMEHERKAKKRKRNDESNNSSPIRGKFY